MLTIAKIRDAGAASRYFEGRIRGERQIDPATGSVRYFAESGEPPGRWLGSEQFGIASGDAAKAGQLERLLRGQHPLGQDDALLVQSSREHRPGWDLTFSASKSVSATWAIADDDLRAQIEAAHDRAVLVAMTYLDQHAGWTRRGHGGVDREQVHLVGITYQHSTSREGDPHLHSHAIVANTARREDGTWGSVDPHDMYVHAQAAGSLYQAQLGRELQRLGFSLERGEGGTIEIDGVPEAITSKWSTRHNEMSVHGRSAEAEAAWAKGRPRKEHVHRPSLYARWQSEAATYGYTRGTIQAIRGIGMGQPPDEAIDMRAVVRDLTAQSSSFTRADLVRTMAVHSYGHLDAAQITTRAEEMLAHAGRSGSPLVRIGYDRDGEGVYSTRRHLRVEQQMLRDMSRLASPVRGRAAKARAIDDAMVAARARGTALSDEQRHALAVATGKSRLSTIYGAAGAGKTTTMRAVRQAYEQSGYRVIGLATNGKAARVLQEEAGITSTTLAAFGMASGYDPFDDYRRHDARRLAHWALQEVARYAKAKTTGRRYHMWSPRYHGQWALSPRTVVILDEASMTDTPAMAALLKEARHRGAKIVMVGDDRQLPAVGTGGGFEAAREITRGVGSDAELSDIRRQQVDWQRDAARSIALGRDPLSALRAYEAHGRVHVAEGRALVEQMMLQWAQDRRDHPGETQIVVASTNAQAALANELAQKHLLNQGALGERVATGLQTAKHGRIDLYVGDEIVFRAPPPEALRQQMPTVINGSLGRVAGRDDQGRIIVDLDDAERWRVVLDPARYDAWHLGYASTLHRGQGVTVGRGYYLVSGRDGYESANVAMTRHRGDLHLFVDRSLYDISQTARTRTQAVAGAAKEARDRLLEQVAQRMSRSQAKHLAITHQHDQARGH